MIPQQAGRPAAPRHAGPDTAAEPETAPVAPGPLPHQMPTAQMDRKHRTREIHPAPQPVAPPQVQPRAEPTAIHGYPGAHAEAPAPQIPNPRTATPGERHQADPLPPTRPDSRPAPAHSAPETPEPFPDAQPQHRREDVPSEPTPASFDQPSAGRPPAAGAGPQPQPIAWLQTAGSEGPRRYADADLGPTWFATKPTPTPDRPTQPKPTSDLPTKPKPTSDLPTQPKPTPDLPTQLKPTPDLPTQSKPTPDLPTQPKPTPDLETQPKPTPDLETQPQPGPNLPQQEHDGVVLDVDLTGFLNGMTAEQAIIEAPIPVGQPAPIDDRPARPGPAADASASISTGPPGPAAPRAAGSAATGSAAPALPAPAALPPQAAAIAASGREAGRGRDGESWRDRDDPARPPLMPGPEPAEPAALDRPLKPLAAADLEAIRWRLDGGTLREVVDDREALRELGDRLDEPLADESDKVTRSGLLSVRAEVYRLLGELGMAAAASRLALAHAESAGDIQSVVIAQAELAHVLRLRGDFAEADRLFEEAASSETHEAVRSVVHENAGRSCFDQGRHMEALDHFARAIRLGSPDDMDLVERIDVSLEAVYIHVLRDGWGPYPRLRREILGYVRPKSA